MTKPKPTSTTPGATVKAVRDVRSLPPSFFRLSTDGPKWLAVCRDRRALYLQLATYADGDGTNIRPSIARLMEELGMSKRTLLRRMSDLIQMEILENGGHDGPHGTRLRHINWDGVWERQAQAEVPNGHVNGAEVPNAEVPDGGPRCQIAKAEVPDSEAEVPDSGAEVPKPPGFGIQPYTATPTALSDRENLPPKAGGMVGVSPLGALPQTPALAAQADPVNGEDDDSEPEATEEEMKADMAKWAQHEWELLMAGLPEVMQGAVLSEDQRKRLAAQLDKYGFEKMLAAIKHWIEVRDYPVEQCRTKWRAWLAEGEAAIAWVRQAVKRARVRKG